MKYTLLEMTQQILVSLDGDEVNSINDTTEANSVAKIIREAYFNIAGMLDLPENKGLFELVATSSATPTIMTLPTNVISLEWVKYNGIKTGYTDDVYADVSYVDFKKFIDNSYMINSTDANMLQFDYTTDNGTFTIKSVTNQTPRIYSSPDDHTIIFDAYDVSEDAFLQASKTQCYGDLAPDFDLEDDFTPTLDHRQFAALLNEAKAQAWADLKQSINNRAENLARQNKIESQKKKRNINQPDRGSYYDSYPNYGRR